MSPRRRKKKQTTKKVVTAIIALIIALIGAFFIVPEVMPEEPPPYIDIANIPAYTDKAYVVINNNVPYFEESDYTTEAYEKYSELDSLGRCGAAMACLGKETMPADGEERGDIGNVTPTGWVQKRYDADIVGGGYLYNRCHLIGWQLSAENDNERNLMTGTRYFNVGSSGNDDDGMVIFENMVAHYIEATGNHVIYRVTPVYEGNNLLAGGILMEGYSVEDKGEGICFNVYFYNVQPGVTIDYATGESELAK